MMWQKAVTNKNFKVLFSLTNMAGVGKPTSCKGEG